MHFTTIIVRNLLLRPLRTVITIVCVAVAVGGFAVLTGLGRGVEEAWNSSLVKQGTHILAYRKGVINLLTGTIDQRMVHEIRKAPGVSSVAMELMDVITLESGASILVRGWDNESNLWQETNLLTGHLPAEGSLESVLIGEGLAEALELKPGDEISPFGAKMKVAGVAQMDNFLNNNSLIMSLQGLQELLDRNGRITVMHIRVSAGQNKEKLDAVRQHLSGIFPQLTFVLAQTAAQQNDLYQFWRGMSWAAALVGLIMGLLIVFNTMLVAVLERTREIGVLAALGWSRSRIITLVLSESLLLSTLGGIAGIILGYYGLVLLAMHPRLQGFVLVSPSLEAIYQQCFVAMILGIGGGFLPAWRAVNLNPIDALREQ